MGLKCILYISYYICLKVWRSQTSHQDFGPLCILKTAFADTCSTKCFPYLTQGTWPQSLIQSHGNALYKDLIDVHSTLTWHQWKQSTSSKSNTFPATLGTGKFQTEDGKSGRHCAAMLDPSNRTVTLLIFYFGVWFLSHPHTAKGRRGSQSPAPNAVEPDPTNPFELITIKSSIYSELDRYRPSIASFYVLLADVSIISIFDVI